jgi:Rrf2 family protein
MSRSTRLLTATYILSYVAANAPEVLTTERIAAEVDEHPTRVRQIVAALVKAGLLAASRGAAGGVSLKKPANAITLFDIQRAVQDSSLLALNLFKPKSEWAGKSQVHLVFENLRDELESRIQHYLEGHTLDETYTPIIVPFSPGGATDILARTLGEYLGSTLGGPVLLEHGESAAPPAPDGATSDNTLTILTSSRVLAAALAEPHDGAHPGPTPVTLLTESEMILAVNARSRWMSVAALAKVGRKRTLRYASVGYGSVSHLCGALFEKCAGVRLAHRPYGGARPAVEALINGDVDLYFGTPPTFLPFARAGHVRPLATTAMRKADAFPDLPRMADIYPGFEVGGWQGVFTPPGTPPERVAALQQRIAAVMAQPDVRKRLARQGFRVVTTTPEQFARRIEQEIAYWRDRLTKDGIDLSRPPAS